MSIPTPEIAACLDGGGVVLLPTDTVLGLAASPRHDSAVARLFALKDRPAEKNLPVMVADAAQIASLGTILSPVAHNLIASPFCPGPLTLVLPLGNPRPDWLTDRSEVAVRIPADTRLLEILRAVGPLLVTSANRSGADTPKSAREAAAQLTARPDMVIDGTSQMHAPSTIVDCTAKSARILRHGAISDEALSPYLEAST
ncbi:L-threonylcarbamoyladenylate synthase [Celeribacter sp.]|uniref:L-threonylcarbamoyladenylate synthase n=1 Tax=Celeribacter sp. TaxID=1890673 RepID=UPI003A8CFEFE